MAETHQLLVDGAWVDAGDGAVFDTLDPATGEVLASVAAAGAADVDLAVAAARRAFDGGAWGLAAPERDRAEKLFALAALLRRDVDELARLETLDCGKPLEDARWDVEEAAFMFEYYAGWATKITGDIPPVGPDALSLVVKEPVGVCGLIVPWNYPILMACQKVAPALAAGCTVVLKPAEQTPLTALALGRLSVEAGLPAGVLNVVTGTGPDAGEPLVTHRGVDKISFTGSKVVGQRIMRLCADDLKRVTLELGGKSPNIVFADADLAEAVPGTALGIFGNQGEVCSAGSRIFVQRPVYDDVLAGLIDEAKAITLGSGLDPDVTMGPLVSAAQRARVEGYIGIGKDEGARLAYEGARPDDPALAGGFYVPPAVFETESLDRTIAREAIFGPVATVVPFDDVAEVTAMANDTEYGLISYVFAKDPGTGVKVARRMESGMVAVNRGLASDPAAPFGGMKESGLGREGGFAGIHEFLETQYFAVDL